MHDGDLRLRAVWSPHAEIDEARSGPRRGSRSSAARASPARPGTTRALVWLHDAQADERFAHVRQLGVRSGLAVPVMSDGTCLGVLEFFDDTVHPRDGEIEATMVSIAGFLGQFMQRRRARGRSSSSPATRRSRRRG